jgi:peptidoglycan/LPS O-acetylase OafA/YrhL
VQLVVGVGEDVTSNRFAYIDALRGYAILLVIAIHSSQYSNDLSYPVRTLADQGARGVQLFFVTSALTLCMSWKARDDGALAFYVRRFFRIAPMFYLAIAFFIWVNGFRPNMYAPDGLGLRHVLMTATFTHGLMPDTITSLVPGSWSVADEMMFYAVFPLVVGVLNRISFSMAAASAAVLTGLCFKIQQHADLYLAHMADSAWRTTCATFTYLWFVQQLPCFLFGMLAFKWTIEDGTVRWPRTLMGLSVVGMVLLAFFHPPDHVVPYISRLGLPIPYGFLFALFALGLMHWQPRALVNPVIGWIGKVSYSAYLIHVALISAVSIPHASYVEPFAVLTVATLALSTVTFFCIEEPFNRLARRLARRLASAGRVMEPEQHGGVAEREPEKVLRRFGAT